MTEVDHGAISRAPDDVSAIRVACSIVEIHGWTAHLRTAVRNRARPLVLGRGDTEGSRWTVWRLADQSGWVIEDVRDLIACPHDKGRSMKRRHDWVEGMQGLDKVDTCDLCGDELPPSP